LILFEADRTEMLGHTPTRLLLTASLLPPDDAVQALCEKLDQEFFGQLHFWSESRSPNIRHDFGSAIVGSQQISFELDFLPLEESVCTVMLLDSAVYEAAYDFLRKRVRPAGKRALVEFCVAVAAAVRAEGLRLDFANDDSRAPLLIESVVSNLTEQPAGLLLGISVRSAGAEAVKAARPKAREVNGYLIVDFI
jgi:hypothetical protein